MAKNIPAVASAFPGAGTNTDLLTQTSSYAGTVAQDSQLRTQIWSELVKRDARKKKRTKRLHRR